MTEEENRENQNNDIKFVTYNLDGELDASREILKGIFNFNAREIFTDKKDEGI